MTAIPALSVVVPVFNEAENLEPLVEELAQVLRPSGVAFEVVLVDDGSRDGSREKIRNLIERFPEISTVRFRENRGQSAAFAAGFQRARGEIVVTMDADRQNDPSDIPRLLAAMNGHAAAVGYRVTRHDDWLRRVSSHIANGVRNRVTGDDIIDTGCSLKAFRRDALKSVKLFAGMHRFLPTLLRIEGHSVVQIPVNHRPRVAGRSKYGVWNRLLAAFVDLLAVRWMKDRHLDLELDSDDPRRDS